MKDKTEQQGRQISMTFISFVDASMLADGGVFLVHFAHIRKKKNDRKTSMESENGTLGEEPALWREFCQYESGLLSWSVVSTFLHVGIIRTGLFTLLSPLMNPITATPFCFFPST
jgi:hypothetical protein